MGTPTARAGSPRWTVLCTRSLLRASYLCTITVPMSPPTDLSRSLLRPLAIVVVGMATGCVGFHVPPDAVPADIAVMDPRFEAISSALVEALESHRLAEGLPALSAAIGVDGELAWAAAAGWANVEARVASSPRRATS